VRGLTLDEPVAELVQHELGQAVVGVEGLGRRERERARAVVRRVDLAAAFDAQAAALGGDLPDDVQRVAVLVRDGATHAAGKCTLGGMARSLVSCGCTVLAVGLGLSVLGAGVAWMSLPGDGLGEKIESLVESFQPVGFKVVDVVALEGGGCDVQIEARPLDSWDVTSLEVSGVTWRWFETEPDPAIDPPSVERTIAHDVTVYGEIQTRPPLLAGREPSTFVVRFPRQPPEGADDLRVRMRIDVSAVKHGGGSKLNLGYDETVYVTSASDDESIDASNIEPSEPR
jgi:hypothetical protein